MKTSVKTESKVKILKIRNNNFHIGKVNNLSSSVDYKLYQKVFIVLFSFTVILIFPELPKQMESVCHSYYSEKKCNSW